MTDPAIEAVAIALAWCERPAPLDPRDNARAWWQQQSEHQRRIYRYRAGMAIEAYEAALAMEARDAAE